MKKIVLYILFFGFFHTTFAQQELKRADSYFERAYYKDAIPLYEALIPTNRSSRLVKNLADCYYRTYDMKSATKWYTYLVSNHGDNIEEDYHFKLSQSLKALGEYNKANQVLIDFYGKRDSVKLNRIQQEIIYLENISAIGDRFSLENLGMNTETSEFGAIQIDSNLVFTATRKNTSSSGKLYRWNNQKYLDIYSLPMDKIRSGDGESVNFSEQINTKMHEGTFAITKDRNTLYFTRNNYNKGKKKTDSKKISNLKIYKAEWVDNGWGKVTELPFNGDNFSTEHPALNTNETTLYFASDRKGGQGSFDIYTVSINSDGTYGTPINLGPTINSDKKEQFPFLDENDNLYFSSNGHPGYGLLDVFVSKNKEGILQKPDNIGVPVNSGYDDFSFVVNGNKKEGFFSSNRPGGKGSDDIYRFMETKPLLIEDCGQYIAGILSDKTTKKPIPNGTVILIDNSGNTVSTVSTLEDASFEFRVDCVSAYTLKGSKVGYEDTTMRIITNKERNKTNDGSLALLSHEEREKQVQLSLQKEEEERLRKEKEAREKAEREKERKIKEAIRTEESIVEEKEKTVIKTKAIIKVYS
ncbi:MAG: carboxypeptidase-like regulatory domain-containing protein, partial [Bacteroidota bacterium]